MNVARLRCKDNIDHTHELIGNEEESTDTMEEKAMDEVNSTMLENAQILFGGIAERFGSPETMPSQKQPSVPPFQEDILDENVSFSLCAKLSSFSTFIANQRTKKPSNQAIHPTSIPMSISPMTASHRSLQVTGVSEDRIHGIPIQHTTERDNQLNNHSSKSARRNNNSTPPRNENFQDRLLAMGMRPLEPEEIDDDDSGAVYSLACNAFEPRFNTHMSSNYDTQYDSSDSFD